MTKIDTTKPLEAVHTKTGKIIPMEFARNCSWSSEYFETTTAPDSATSNTMWHFDGGDRCSRNEWTIRNVAEIDINRPLRLVDTHERVTFLELTSDGEIKVQLPKDMDPQQISRFFTAKGTRDSYRASGSQFRDLRLENVPVDYLDLDRPLQTRDGRLITLLSSSAAGPSPLVVQFPNGTVATRPLNGGGDIINTPRATTEYAAFSMNYTGISLQHTPDVKLMPDGVLIKIERIDGKVIDVSLVRAGE